MSDKKKPNKKDSKVCVVGVKSAGKTVAVYNIVNAMKRGMHAFSVSNELECLEIDDNLKSEHQTIMSQLPEESKQSNEFRFDFKINRENSGPEQWSVQCLDVPGEIFRKSYDPTFKKDRENYEEFCREANGGVFMLSVFDLFDPDKVTDIVGEILQFENNSPEESGVILAITMFELLLIPFGGYATQYVSNHLFVRNHLQRILAKADLHHHFMVIKRDIRISAISSFGFVPRLGSSNVNPEQPSIAAEHGGALGTPYEGNKCYPFMVADPFVYAATGYDNNFIFHSEEVLNPS